MRLSDPSALLKQLIRPYPIGGSSLVRDYLQEKPAALAFYPGSPFNLASYRNKLEEVSARFTRSERENAARALKPTSPTAADRLRRFVEEGGAMVTTGQQAGFLTGPLYTVYKALSTVVLARHLEAEFGRIVIPVFWVASDDHDWAEVNHAYLLDSSNRLVRLGLEGGDEALPMSARRLEGDLEKLSEHVSQVVAGSVANRDIVREILDPWNIGGRTVAEAFGDSMRSILSPFDVCLADAADPELKRAALPILRRALSDSAGQEERLTERTQAIEDAGYHGQVAVLATGTNVFRFNGEARERLYVRGQDFTVRERRLRIPREELLVELEADPTTFSPNVFLRPVVESGVFPTLAYVGGPGEIAYFAQAGALFETHGMTPPVVVPRFAGLVVEPKVEKLLASLGLGLDEAESPREALIEKLARNALPPEVADMLARLRTNMVGDFAALLEQSEEIDPTLLGALGASRNRTLLEAARAERKIIRAIKRSDRVAIDKLDRTLASLRPLGEPQDRVLNILPFIARYGRHFIPEIERTVLSSWRLPNNS